MSVQLEHYRKAVKVLAELVARKHCRLAIGPPFGLNYLQFVYDHRQKDVADVFAGAALSADQMSDAADEISEALTATVEGVSVERFVAMRNSARQRREEEPEPSDIATEKLQLAQRSFDVDDLRQRAWIKKTSKAEIPVGMEWEVSLKVEDDDRPRPVGSPVPFATLLMKSTTAGPISLLEEHRLAMTMDLEDIEITLQTLERLRLTLLEETHGDNG